MRVAESKSDLRKLIGVTMNKRAFGTLTHIIIDVSPSLWTLNWPTKGQFGQFIEEVKRRIEDMLKHSHVHWIQDRYRDYSPKSACRISPTNDAATPYHHIR